MLLFQSELTESGFVKAFKIPDRKGFTAELNQMCGKAKLGIMPPVIQEGLKYRLTDLCSVQG